MNSYFQRLASQTWGTTAPSLPKPNTARSQPLGADFGEVHEEVVSAPVEAMPQVPLRPAQPVGVVGLPAEPMASQSKPLLASASEDTPHPIAMPPVLTEKRSPDRFEEVLELSSSSAPVLTAASTPPAIPSHLASILPASPVMEEVVRWLSAPPVLAKENALRQAPRDSAPAAPEARKPEDLVEEVIIRDDRPSTSPSRLPVATRSLSNRTSESAARSAAPEADPMRSIAPPDVTVTIGTVQVTIEAPPPPPAPARTVERPAPQPATPAGTSQRERRSSLARRYL